MCSNKGVMNCGSVTIDIRVTLIIIVLKLVTNRTKGIDEIETESRGDDLFLLSTI